MSNKIVVVLLLAWVGLMLMFGRGIFESLNSTSVGLGIYENGGLCVDRNGNTFELSSSDSITAHRDLGVGKAYLKVIKSDGEERLLYETSGWKCKSAESEFQQLFASNIQ